MPTDGGQGNPWVYRPQHWQDGRVWFVLKCLGWGPGHSQTVEFDNASVDGSATPLPDLSTWMLY